MSNALKYLKGFWVFNMKKSIDLIVVWPTNCDYPLWRHQLKNIRHYFNKVVIAFTGSPQSVDYKEFVIEQLSNLELDIVYANDVPSESDWRDYATRLALAQSNSQWVFFTEQDFYFDETLLLEVDKNIDKYKAIGIKEGERIHPACLFIERQYLNTFSIDFGIVPNKHDHFYKITKQINKQNIYILPTSFYSHMNGLSHNLHLMQNDLKVTYKPDDFASWLGLCLDCGVRIHPIFKKFANSYLAPYAIIKNL